MPDDDDGRTIHLEARHVQPGDRMGGSGWAVEDVRTVAGEVVMHVEHDGHRTKLRYAPDDRITVSRST